MKNKKRYTETFHHSIVDLYNTYNAKGELSGTPGGVSTSYRDVIDIRGNLCKTCRELPNISWNHYLKKRMSVMCACVFAFCSSCYTLSRAYLIVYCIGCSTQCCVCILWKKK